MILHPNPLKQELLYDVSSRIPKVPFPAHRFRSNHPPARIRLHHRNRDGKRPSADDNQPRHQDNHNNACARTHATDGYLHRAL